MSYWVALCGRFFPLKDPLFLPYIDGVIHNAGSEKGCRIHWKACWSGPRRVAEHYGCHTSLRHGDQRPDFGTQWLKVRVSQDTQGYLITIQNEDTDWWWSKQTVRGGLITYHMVDCVTCKEYGKHLTVPYQLIETPRLCNSFWGLYQGRTFSQGVYQPQKGTQFLEVRVYQKIPWCS